MSNHGNPSAVIISPEAITKVLVYPHKIKTKALLNLLFDAGLSTHELKNLKWIELFPQYVVADGLGKPIRKETFDLLMQVKRIERDDCPFPNGTSWFNYVVREAFRNAGVSGNIDDIRLANKDKTDISLSKRVIPEDVLGDTACLVSDFLSSRESAGLSPETVRWYQDFLRRFTAYSRTLPTESKAIERFIGTFTSGDQRRRNAYRALRIFYGYLELRYKTPNPFKCGMRPPKVQRKEKASLTLPQLKQLLDYPHKPKMKALLSFLVDTGARVGEATNLSQEDIFESTAKVCGKTGERIVPISPTVKGMLESLGPGKLWPGKSHWLTEQVTQAFKDAGLPGFTAHSLRHTFVTLFRGSEISLKAITGHRSWQMLENYSHRRLERAQAEHIQGSPLAQLNPQNMQPAAPTAASAPTDVTDNIIASLIKKSRGLVNEYDLARGSYYLNALLFNVTDNLLKLLREYKAKRWDGAEFCFEELGDEAWLELDDNKTVTELRELTRAKYETVWGAMAILLEPIAARYKSQATALRELSASEVPIDNVSWQDIITVWERGARC